MGATPRSGLMMNSDADGLLLHLKGVCPRVKGAVQKGQQICMKMVFGTIPQTTAMVGSTCFP